mmetsp:Transcript_19923/g.60329  ORF Transcript_19923/g.60329 Transcript_19923/m.60329 type:complete len:239 (-) Transcript_19923:554-1270(-)
MGVKPMQGSAYSRRRLTCPCALLSSVPRGDAQRHVLPDVGVEQRDVRVVVAPEGADLVERRQEHAGAARPDGLDRLGYDVVAADAHPRLPRGLVHAQRPESERPAHLRYDEPEVPALVPLPHRPGRGVHGEARHAARVHDGAVPPRLVPRRGRVDVQALGVAPVLVPAEGADGRVLRQRVPAHGALGRLGVAAEVDAVAARRHGRHGRLEGVLRHAVAHDVRAHELPSQRRAVHLLRH